MLETIREVYIEGCNGVRREVALNIAASATFFIVHNVEGCF